MSPLQYCTQQTAPPGSTMYYSLRYLPRNQYTKLLPIIAFAYAIRRIPVECSDPNVAKAKLAWWHSEIEQLNLGEPTHPISLALQPVIKAHNLQFNLFQDYIQGIETNMKYQGYHNVGDLIQHCHRFSYIPMLLTAQVLNIDPNTTQNFLHHLGIALSLFNILYGLRDDIAHNNVYFPTEDLNRFALNASDLIQNKPQNQTNICQLLAFEAQRVREFYQKALDDLSVNLQHQFMPYLIQAAITMKLLDEIEHDGFNILNHRIALTPLRKFWLARKVYKKIKQGAIRAKL